MWGESRSVSQDLVRKNDLRLRSDELALAAADVLSHQNTSHTAELDRLELALKAWREARYAE